MSRSIISCTREDQRSDFNDLIGERQTELVEMSVEEKTAEVSSSSGRLSLPESKERHRLMSASHIKYLYSRKIGVIHDKHCICARSILDEDLCTCEEYIPQLNPCPECSLMAYTAAGAKDPEDMRKYLAFFEKARFSDKQIRDIYVDRGMKTRISIDTMTIWYRDDVWRIKCLARKGHVQLFHNNYVVRKKGVREFTQGFHIQNPACEDTNITYALSIIQNYMYAPQESALHRKKISENEKKVKQPKPEKQEMMVMSLEELLGEKTVEKPLWQQAKDYIRNMFKKKNFFTLNNFQVVSECGYPKNQTICIYIWRDKNGQISRQTGFYDENLKHFSVCDGTTAYAIRLEKVLA